MIRTHQIRDPLIVNFDEICSAVLPAESYTMEVRGAGQVTITGKYSDIFKCVFYG